jgi:hypothetical protein
MVPLPKKTNALGGSLKGKVEILGDILELPRTILGNAVKARPPAQAH